MEKLSKNMIKLDPIEVTQAIKYYIENVKMIGEVHDVQYNSHAGIKVKMIPAGMVLCQKCHGLGRVYEEKNGYEGEDCCECNKKGYIQK
jgi:hypothetical protein